MNTPAGPDDEAQGARERLARVEAQTREAQRALDRLHADVAQAQERLRGAQQSPVVAVNQQLVLAMLRAQIDAEAQAHAATEAARAARLHLEEAHAASLKQLREANENLVMAALAAQTLEAAAEQARKRQTELLALVAHELRHPLAPISNVAALLGHVTADKPVLVRLQGIIERQVVHMARLVDDLMDITRVSTGKMRLHRSVVDLAGLLDDVLAGVKGAVDRRSQKLVLQLPPGPMMVDGDPVRLAQVLFNLLDNASKYTHTGGEISLRMVPTTDAVAITVADSGIGITSEALPHVFDPFVQDIHATVFNGAGLGIGLTVVKELVEAHGGSVVASSPGIGLGSRFVVTLPLYFAGNSTSAAAS